MSIPIFRNKKAHLKAIIDKIEVIGGIIEQIEEYTEDGTIKASHYHQLMIKKRSLEILLINYPNKLSSNIIYLLNVYQL